MMEVGYSFDRARLITKFDQLVSADELKHLGPVAKNIALDFSLDPFIKQRDIAKKYSLSSEELAKINDQLSNSPLIRDMVINHGPASAYWANTILPLYSSKHFQSVLDNEFVFPQLVGLHIGMSCMFRCHFCPRNHDVTYDHELAEQSLRLVKSLFDQSPKDHPNWQTRFGISGGHEPLTNPYLGDMIDYGSDLGYKIRIYSNGYMLTPKILSKKPGLLRASAIRISMYGVDEDSYDHNTQTKKGWQVVSKNIPDSLSYIKSAGSSTKLGLNWIVLPGQAHMVKQLIGRVREWNQHGNGIGFVTLREDYSPDQSELINEEKSLLLETFDWIQREQAKGNLNDTVIDYGYALNPLACGFNDFGPIKKARPQIYNSKGYPQLSVQVDPRGDVNVFHAGYQDKPGAAKYHIGNLNIEPDLATIVKDHLRSDQHYTFDDHDEEFMDSFDHAVQLIIDQMHDDAEFGIPWSRRFTN
jgi:dTDP-4-amino-4,6-dideoxy-D-glucose ammonia-lyase